jgi:hypothetical protein
MLLCSLALLLVAGVAGARPTPAQKCSAAKIRAAVKKAQANGQCYQRAALTAGGVDAGCLAVAEKKFTAAFAAAEKKGGCSTVGDRDEIGGNVDTCVQDIVAALPATTTTTITASTTTTTIAEPAGLAGITAAHNQVRAGVGVGPMTWSAALAATAQAWADTCTDVAAPIGLLDHNANRSVGAPYYVGENIYGSSGTADPQGAVASWASEVQYYTYATNTCAGGQVCGHYTQVVWAASLEVGCGLSSCPGLTYGSSIVCDYGPGGNDGGPPY